MLDVQTPFWQPCQWMNQEPTKLGFGASLACCFIVGAALRMGGVQYGFSCVIIMFFLLAAAGRCAVSELLIVASVCGGKVLCEGMHLLILDATNPSMYRLSLILEPVAVAVIAIALLITHKPALTWCLITYSALMFVLLLWLELFHRPTSSRSRVAYSDAIISVLFVGLLVRWLRNNRSTIPC